MKNIFKVGDSKVHEKRIEQKDLASFGDDAVHPVCSTFALAREMEWASRLFVLEMLADDEEGIGTRLEINHLSPALPGEKLTIKAIISKLAEHEIICDISVHVGNRVIATGVTGQKVLKKSKIASLISNIQKDGREEE